MTIQTVLNVTQTALVIDTAGHTLGGREPYLYDDATISPANFAIIQTHINGGRLRLLTGGVTIPAPTDGASFVSVTVVGQNLVFTDSLGGTSTVAVPGGDIDLSAYATTASVAAAVADKVTTTDLSTGLAAKVNSATYTAGLATKADATAVDAVATTASNAATAAAAATTAVAGKANARPGGLYPFDIRMLDRRTAPINILSIGSSTVRGNQTADYRSRFPDQLGQILHAAFNPAGIPGGRHTLVDENASEGGTWTVGGGSRTQVARGFGLNSSSMPAGVYVEGNFDLATGFEVQYNQGTGIGPFKVTIDGTDVATVTPSTSGSIAATGSWKSAKLTRGAHTVRITSTTGTTEINGVYAYDGDESLGIRSYVSGHGGYTVIDYNGTAGLTLRQRVAAIQPAIVILCWGSNDWKDGIAVATFKSRLLTQISELTSVITGPVTFVLVAQAQRIQNPGSGSYAPYVTAIREVAEADPATRVYVEAASQFPTSTAADVYSLFSSDGIHPSDRGQTLITDIISRALQLPSGSLGKVAPASTTPAVPDTTAPTAPTTVTATGGNASATVNASGATDAVGVTGYRVYTVSTGGSPVVTGNSPLAVTGLTNGQAYTFYVSAVDAAGNESTRTASNSVTPAVPASARPAQAPATTTQPALWLRADEITGVTDGATLATWTANTGPNATTVTTNSGTSPTYRSSIAPTSKPAVAFVKANVNKMQSALSNAPADLTILSVLRTPDTAVSGIIFQGVTTDASVAGRFRVQVGQGGGSLQVLSQGSTGVSGLGHTANTWEIVRAQYATNGAPTAAVNGTATSDTTAVSSASATAIALGGFGTSSVMTVDYAEVIVFKGVMSDADARLWEQYLGTTYGITVATA